MDGMTEFNRKNNGGERIVMRNPEFVIGSDRIELYEFFGRRKE